MEGKDTAKNRVRKGRLTETVKGKKTTTTKTKNKKQKTKKQKTKNKKQKTKQNSCPIQCMLYVFEFCLLTHMLTPNILS